MGDRGVIVGREAKLRMGRERASVGWKESFEKFEVMSINDSLAKLRIHGKIHECALENRPGNRSCSIVGHASSLKLSGTRYHQPSNHPTVVASEIDVVFSRESQQCRRQPTCHGRGLTASSDLCVSRVLVVVFAPKDVP